MAGRAIRQVRDIQPEYVSVDEAQALTGVSRWSWRDMA
jgi:hypothetical protein